MSTFQNHAASSSRVNIKLSMHTNGEQEKKELGFKMLFLGAFEGNVYKKSFSQQQKQSINSQNYNQVLSHLSPQLSIRCDNYLESSKDTLSLSLTFQSMEDFSPDGLCQNVPELKKMVAMRHVLKDLKSLMLDNKIVKENFNALIAGKQKAIETTTS